MYLTSSEPVYQIIDRARRRRVNTEIPIVKPKKIRNPLTIMLLYVGKLFQKHYFVAEDILHISTLLSPSLSYHTDTHTHSHTLTHTHTHHTHSHTLTLSLSRKQTHTHTYTYTLSPSLTRTLTYAHSISLVSHPPKHTRTLSFSHSLSLSLSYTRFLSLSLFQIFLAFISFDHIQATIFVGCLHHT